MVAWRRQVQAMVKLKVMTLVMSGEAAVAVVKGIPGLI